MLPLELLSAFLGLTSAISWGAGDFFGGLAAKRTGLYQVVIGSQFIGVIILVIMALIFQEVVPPFINLAIAGFAGLAGAVGLLCLYRALALGRMGLAAPVSGVLSAAIPILAAAFLDKLPGWLTLAGFAVALVAGWLISRSEDVVFRLSDLGLPLIAGFSFGFFIAIISRFSAGAVFWPLVAARVASLTALTLFALFTRQRILPARPELGLILASGVLDAGGNAFLVLAAHLGRKDVAAVLSSLYPASTVLLAWAVLKEKLTRWQSIGVLAALAAIVMITI
jgi:drug/metabolite transporter (DMT)-like permease